MERSDKLADLTLVSKYHPVANYSYPRNDTAAVNNTVCASHSDRRSLGSQASAPGLIDDRTDSEASVDIDDYQYHAHTTELWDSFWQPDKAVDEHAMLPRKHYPALIPSPRGSRRRQMPPAAAAVAAESSAWPLSDGSPRDSSRKAATTFFASPKSQPSPSYSAFPRLPSTPQPASSPPPLQTSFKSRLDPFAAPSAFRRHAHSVYSRRQTVHTASSHGTNSARRSGSDAPQATASSVAHRLVVFLIHPSGIPALWTTTSVRPRTAHTHAHTSSAASTFSANQALEQARQPPGAGRVPRHHRSMTQLPRPLPKPEPRSVFELDSDSDDDNGRSFFRFHRRNDSDSRRTTKSSTIEGAPSRGAHPQTAPSLPEPPQTSRLCRPDAAPKRRRHGHDMFGRMLGRGSR